jgi:hypothetical protein
MAKACGQGQREGDEEPSLHTGGDFHEVVVVGCGVKSVYDHAGCACDLARARLRLITVTLSRHSDPVGQEHAEDDQVR